MDLVIHQLSSKLVLAQYHLNLLLKLVCEASSHWVRVAICQVMLNVEENTNAIGSRTLSKTIHRLKRKL